MTELRTAIEVLDFIHGRESVSKATFRTWMRATDSDVLGAIYQAAAYHWSRIETGVTRKEFGLLLSRLVGATLERSGESRYALSDHAAVRTLCGFLADCYNAREIDPDAMASLRSGVLALGRLYKNGSVRQRRCIVDAGIEHLFEQPGVEKYFARWRTDSVLSKAYEEALAWANSRFDETS